MACAVLAFWLIVRVLIPIYGATRKLLCAYKHTSHQQPLVAQEVILEGRLADSWLLASAWLPKDRCAAVRRREGDDNGERWFIVE